MTAASVPSTGWSPRLLHTLATAFATLAPQTPDEAARRALLAAETLDAAADPDDLRLLKLAIGSLEVPPALLATAGRWGRFSAMEHAQREAVLRAWSRHPVGRIRTAFAAVKRLGLFLAYADPGADGSGNPAWPRIGYVPAAPVPVPAGSIVPLAVHAEGGTPLLLEADAVVVGSGAGGGVVAARLAAAGRAVLVVEAGPYLAEAAMPANEADGMSRLYLDRGTTSSADLGITIFAGAGLGGGTTVNWTTSIAPPEWLRDEWDHVHGLDGLAGPATDAALARLSSELDLRPPTVMPPKDQAILDGAAALGWEAAATERDAGPCTDCGACGFGCRAGNKRSGLRAHLAAAAAGGARFLVDARVERVEIAGGRAAGRAAGVSGTVRTSNGASRPFRVAATQVVLAAGPLRTPLLLRASGIDHPELGRNLRLHPVVAVAARMPAPVDMWLGPTQAARSLQFWRPGPADPAGIGPAHGGFVIESAPAHPGLIASASAWQGSAPHAALMEQARYLAPLIGIVRDSGAGRVRSTRHGRARIDYRLDPADARSAHRALVETARLARAAGALDVLALTQPLRHARPGDGSGTFDAFLRGLASASLAPNRVTIFSAHQMGSARAGADPRSHPCDPLGRVRQDAGGRTVPGLHVADASLFPSASGVNPMLTVMVLADRVAQGILAGA